MANVPHWEKIDGDKAKEVLGLKSFVLLNDFEAASFGILNCKEDDLIQLNGAQGRPNKIKVVMGPGTGLGLS